MALSPRRDEMKWDPTSRSIGLRQPAQHSSQRGSTGHHNFQRHIRDQIEHQNQQFVL